MSEVLGNLDPSVKHLAEVGTLEKFNYPSGKRQTLATTQKMQQAETNLDIFWSQVDKLYEAKAGRSLHETLGSVLKEWQLQRTADWIEPDKESIRTKKDEDDVDITSSRLADLEFEKRTESTVTTGYIGEERQKLKTRGE